MKKSLILSRILSDPRYTFRVDDIILPIETMCSSGKLSNLMEARDLQLGNQSSYSRNLRSDLIASDIKFIQEVPIPIENRELWRELVASTGATRFEGRGYFILDYYFPGTNIIAEVDSNFHKGNEDYDSARDAYMWICYGLRTLRAYEYGEDEVNRELFLSSLKNSISRCEEKVSLTFHRSILSLFSYKNNDLILKTDKVESVLGSFEFGRSYKIYVTEKDLPIKNVGEGSRVKTFVKDFFGKDLYIALGVKSKGIKEIQAIISKKSSFKWTTMVGKSIPFWLTYIYGEVPKRYINRITVIKNEEEDKGVYRLLSKINTV